MSSHKPYCLAILVEIDFRWVDVYCSFFGTTYISFHVNYHLFNNYLFSLNLFTAATGLDIYMNSPI